MKKLVVAIALFLSMGVAGVASAASSPKHALVKVAAVVATPVVHPKRTAKQLLGTVLFATENVVDVAHGGFFIADKVFDTISVAGKVPVLDAVYGVVSTLDTDTGKLDTWLERQEQYLFGTHN